MIVKGVPLTGGVGSVSELEKTERLVPRSQGTDLGLAGVIGADVVAERLASKAYEETIRDRPIPFQRRYLPTLADLIDRLSIVQLKAVFIPERRDEYMKERADIEHDINLIIKEKGIAFDATAIHACLVVMLANRYIWESESKARAGGNEQDKLLKLTHSINGIRNAAKNQIAAIENGARLDYKLDCLASDLPPEFGNWKVFE